MGIGNGDCAGICCASNDMRFGMGALGAGGGPLDGGARGQMLLSPARGFDDALRVLVVDDSPLHCRESCNQLQPAESTLAGPCTIHTAVWLLPRLRPVQAAPVPQVGPSLCSKLRESLAQALRIILHG